ncbi:hypothetical protein, partial [Azospirillum sp. B4]|uniref:hypothetical protein n=1 Tax=Azospirillum sp. B4 TaxID=95605 RepID=UPI0011DE54BD
MRDKRDLTIEADTPEELKRLIEQIPGYQRVELDPDLRARMGLAHDQDWFILNTPSNDEIHVSIDAGSSTANTRN